MLEDLMKGEKKITIQSDLYCPWYSAWAAKYKSILFGHFSSFHKVDERLATLPISVNTLNAFS